MLFETAPCGLVQLQALRQGIMMFRVHVYLIRICGNIVVIQGSLVS